MSDHDAKRILVIEDDTSLTIALSIRLRNSGHKVTVTHDGTSGIKEAIAFKPDVIVLDVQLPDMNGIEVIRRLKADSILAEIPVICVSATISESTTKAALSAGAHAYVNKPYDASHLVETIRQAFVLQYTNATEEAVIQ